MKKEIAIALILLLLLLSKKKPKDTGTFIDPLVTSYKDPEGNVYFAIQLADKWYQVNATKSEEREVINCKIVGQCKVYYLISKPTPDGFSLTVIREGNVLATYFADKEGITI